MNRNGRYEFYSSQSLRPRQVILYAHWMKYAFSQIVFSSKFCQNKIREDMIELRDSINFWLGEEKNGRS